MPSQTKESKLIPGWILTTVDSLSGGMNRENDASLIDDQEAVLAQGVIIDRDKLVIDTGYTAFGQTLDSAPRFSMRWRRKNGSIEYLLLTKTSAWKWNSTLTVWQKIPSSVRTTASAGEPAGETVIALTSVAGFSATNTVVLVLDNGSHHTTTISSVGASDITIAAGIPTGRTLAVGGVVFRPIALTGSDSFCAQMVPFPALDWVVIVNGVDRPQRYDGTDVIEVPNLPSGGDTIARTAIVWNNYLILGYTTEGGTIFPNRLRWSDTGDPTNWSTANAGFEDLYGSDAYIVSTGVIGPYLVVYRSNLITRGQYVGTVDQLFTFEDAVPGVGIPCLHAWFDVEGSHIILTDSNIFEYKGGFDVQEVGDKIRDLMFGPSGELNKSAIARSFVFYYKERDEIWIGYPKTSEVGCDRLLRMRRRDGAWTYRVLADAVLGLSIYNRDSSVVWSGATGTWDSQTGTWTGATTNDEAPTVLMGGIVDTKIFQYDLTSSTDDGTGIAYRVETKRYTSRDRFIRVDKLRANTKGSSILVEYSTDGGNTWNTYGTLGSSAGYSTKGIDNQIVVEDLMWAFSGTGGGFGMSWFGFKYRDESQWAGG